MANYVLTLPLKTEKWQEDILEKRLNIARQIMLKSHYQNVGTNLSKEIFKEICILLF
ncbi:hypothetical protein UT300018_12540 [Clostridium faecium]